MSMTRLANAVRQQARASQNEYALPQFATISSYDAGNHAVKVIVQPVDPEFGTQESNWMPLGAIGIGNGWGVAVGPQIGDQVLVVFEGGDFSSGTIVARVFSVAQQAPAVPSGEIWALHSTGAFIKMVTSGDINVSTPGNLNATVGGNMTANITGNATTNAKQANVTASQSASVTAPTIKLGASGQTLLSFVTSAMVSFFNSHTHTSSSSGSPTSVPNQTMGSAQLTSTVTGG
jgi:phage baseplate assembly protein gpV